MAKKKMCISGTKLKMLARMVESSGVGGMLKRTIAKQMGLGAIAAARIADDEGPAVRPAAPYDALQARTAGKELKGGT
jgi:hypothetical protein